MHVYVRFERIHKLSFSPKNITTFLDGVAVRTSSINYRSFGFPLVIENLYV